MTTDAAYMARALALAERGRATTSPNPMVGAVVVDAEGVVVGRGSHVFAGGPHAEVIALADAGDRARGATLYCTLEPCSHTGRTGPCAPLVVAAGITRAVLAMVDPNPLVGGKGIALLRQHGLDVTVGVLETEASRLNAAFLTRIRRARPLVTMKVALSADGRVALRGGRAVRLTGAVADRRVHRDRAEVDAVLVGSGTLVQDDPLLTPRIAFRQRPLIRAVLDRRLRTPPSARLLSTLDSGPVIIITEAPALEALPERAEQLRAAGALLAAAPATASSPEAGALAVLFAAGASSVVLEGGPTVQRAFWDRGLVDRVQMYVTPHVIGVEGVSWWTAQDTLTSSLADVRSAPLGPDVLIEGNVHRAD